MAIVIRLDDLLHDRRMTLTELADRIGLTLANLSILKTGKARAIRFSTLEAICEALSCQPGDIIGFEPALSEHGRPTTESLDNAGQGSKVDLSSPAEAGWT
jgi:putative transcriptional regulator